MHKRLFYSTCTHTHTDTVNIVMHTGLSATLPGGGVAPDMSEHVSLAWKKINMRAPR